MKFSAAIDAKSMLDSVRRATSVINRTTIPVLGYVRLKAKSGRIVVGGTNLDCWIESECVAEQSSGDILVPGKRFESALALLAPGAGAEITCDETRLKIVSARTKFEMPTLPPEDWPACPPLKDQVSLTIPAKEFIASCESLRPAIGTETARYYLMGILFDFAADRMVATNGHILGWEPKCWSIEGDAAPHRFILPSDALNPIRKMLDGAGDFELLVGRGGQRVTFRHDGQTLTTKTVEGEFPHYERIVPATYEKVFLVDAADASAALKRAASVTDGGKSIPVAMDFTDIELTMRAKAPEVGTAEDACAATMVSGKGGLVVGAASRYLTWALESLPETATVEFHLTDPGMPICLLAKGDADRRHIRVVMTMRLYV